MEKKHRGIISRHNDRGYAFIKPEGGEKDIFFHARDLTGVRFDSLFEGSTVFFDIQEGPKGPIAHNVSLLIAEDTFDVVHTGAIPPPGPATAIVLNKIMPNLVRHLRSVPDDIYRIDPHTFQLIVAEIINKEGYDVQFISPPNKADGGVDIFAIRIDDVSGENRVAVQCKRNQKRNRISAEPIRALNGVLDHNQAHKGILITTSYFTKQAIEEVRTKLYKIGLRDYDYIRGKLNELDLHL